MFFLQHSCTKWVRTVWVKEYSIIIFSLINGHIQLPEEYIYFFFFLQYAHYQAPSNITQNKSSKPTPPVYSELGPGGRSGPRDMIQDKSNYAQAKWLCWKINKEKTVYCEELLHCTMKIINVWFLKACTADCSHTRRNISNYFPFDYIKAFSFHTDVEVDYRTVVY